jgi:hypothetical protein
LYDWLAARQVGPVGAPGEDASRLVYDDGGIRDELSGRVMGEHYSATFFALASAIQYTRAGRTEHLDRAIRATAFHIRTASDRYAFSEWPYHWEFNNYAFAEAYDRLEPYLAADTRAAWLAAMRRWSWSGAEATNWAGMRALAALRRYRSGSRRLQDRWTYKRARDQFLRAQNRDGCFEDLPGRSRPLQYHAYCAALLFELARLEPNDGLISRFAQGAAFLAAFVDDEGIFNYLGRGQRQLFGQVTAIYGLFAAAKVCPERADDFRRLGVRLWGHLLSHQRPDGSWPLILNRNDDRDRRGWYDYHHVTVYNAFAAVWLAKTVELLECSRPETSTVDCATAVDGRDVTSVVFEDTRVAVVSRARYLCVTAGGSGHYATDAAATIDHLTIRGSGSLISCAGGPSPRKYGARYADARVDEQFAGPIARLARGGWVIPQSTIGARLRHAGDVIEWELDYDGMFVLFRSFRFEPDRLSILDRLQFSRTASLAELRYCSIPIQLTGFEIGAVHPAAVEVSARADGSRVLIESAAAPPGATGWERSGEAWSAAGPVALLVRRLTDLTVAAGTEYRHEFAIQIEPPA